MVDTTVPGRLLLCKAAKTDVFSEINIGICLSIIRSETLRFGFINELKKYARVESV